MKWIALIMSAVTLNAAVSLDGWAKVVAIGFFLPSVAEYTCQLVAERMKGGSA